MSVNPKDYYTDEKDKLLTKLAFYGGISFLILCFALCIFASYAVADTTISNETGDTWIIWSWDTIESYDVWIDNQEVLTEYTINNTILTGLNPDELHLIELRTADYHVLEARQYTKTSSINANDNAVNTLASDITNPGNYLFWLALGLVFFIIGIFHFRLIWILTCGFMIVSLVLYAPNLTGDFASGAMIAFYGSMILLSAYGLWNGAR